MTGICGNHGFEGLEMNPILSLGTDCVAWLIFRYDSGVQ